MPGVTLNIIHSACLDKVLREKLILSRILLLSMLPHISPMAHGMLARIHQYLTTTTKSDQHDCICELVLVVGNRYRVHFSVVRFSIVLDVMDVISYLAADFFSDNVRDFRTDQDDGNDS